ncbi:penicillin-binding protein [Bacteroidia bacterium]|nr:penicillin-binding protein [Bacteroidia bacterium]
MKKGKLSKRQRDKRIKICITVSIVILLVVGGICGGLSAIVHHYATNEIAKIEEQYKLDIRYKGVHLKGFSGVEITGLTIIPEKSPFLFYARISIIRANIWKTAFSKEDIKGFEINDLHIRLTQNKNKADDQPDFAAVVDLVYNALGLLSPDLFPNVSIHGLHFTFRDKEGKDTPYYVPSVLISGSRFVAQMINDGDEMNAPAKWVCRGTYQEKTSKLSLRMYKIDTEQAILPFLESRMRATVKFDTIAVEFQRRETNKEQLVRGKVGVKGLIVDQPDLASSPIYFGKGFANFKFNVGENYIELDSSATNIKYNRLDFHPYFRLSKNKDWRLKLAVDKPSFPVDDLFSSLPKGMFINLDGLKVSGTMSYHFLFDVDMTRIEDLVFESTADTRNFKILSYGKTDLRRMSYPFEHVIYEDGKRKRSFEVGPENENFAPLRSLPRILSQAILHAEDYAFYSHKGFFPEAFHRSLVEDIQTRRFARGASTLSMQVVKNVFLNQEKTVSRKFEEILIVWLIENNRLTTKDRMLEVYLNVIEWGPNIYGITEASRYFFIKEPKALTLSEIIFLTYVIPSPKHIRDNFDGLRPKASYNEFFKDAVKRLQRRGVISSWEASRANPNVNLRGAVVRYLNPEK